MSISLLKFSYYLKKYQDVICDKHKRLIYDFIQRYPVECNEDQNCTCVSTCGHVMYQIRYNEIKHLIQWYKANYPNL